MIRWLLAALFGRPRARRRDSYIGGQSNADIDRLHS